MIFLCFSAVSLTAAAQAADSSRQRLIRAVEHADQGSCRRASAQLKKISADYPILDVALFYVAACFADKGSLDKAKRLLVRAEEASPPGSPLKEDLRLLAAFVAAAKGEEAVLRRMLVKLPMANEIKDGSQLTRYIATIKFLAARNSAEDRLRELYLHLLKSGDDKELAPLFGDKPPTQRWQDVDFLKELATSYFSSKRYALAAKLYEQYFAASQDFSVLYRLSRVYKTLKQPDDQERALKRKVERSPDLFEKQISLIQLGRFYWNRNLDDKATKAFIRAIGLDSRSDAAVSANYYLGRLLEGNGELRKADRSLLRNIDIKPEDELFIKRRLQSILRAAWLAFKQKRFTRSVALYERAILMDTTDLFRDHAFFWQARALAASGRQAQAKVTYQRIADDYPLSYYASLATKQRGVTNGHMEHSVSFLNNDAFLARLSGDLKLEPMERLLLDRYMEMVACKLYKLADREVRAISWSDKSEKQLLYIANLLQSSGNYSLALRMARFAVDYRERVIHKRWLQVLYPRPNDEAVRRFALANGIDPFLMFSVMRQESAFDHRAVSWADAYGLMQIIPPTARKIAPNIGVNFSEPAELFNATLNLRLAAFHLGYLSRRYKDNFADVFAAYNASEGAVKRWRQRFTKIPEDVYVEEIPYGETKTYIKKVLGNYHIYRQLYLGFHQNTS